MPKFKVPQKVKHDYFGIGQTIMYDSGTRKYTVQFGQDPVITKRVDESDLSDCVAQSDEMQLSLEVFV